MAKIAHTQNDVKKRRATFEERWKAFQGNMYNEEQIRKAVFAPIKLVSLNTYFCKERNPLFGFDNGVFSYTEEPFRQALVKAKADLSMFKMSERKDKNSHGCFITYKDVEMHIWRWSVEGSPFGSYTVIPALQLAAEASWKIEESRFFWLNLPRLLMDVALEYSIRNEEFKYHLQHLKVFNMNTMVFDESNITLSDNPDEWKVFFTKMGIVCSFELCESKKEYTNCQSDIEDLSSETDYLTLMNNFVNPYNSYKKLYVATNAVGKITISLDKLYTEEEKQLINT
jgi:hypothetical protein